MAERTFWRVTTLSGTRCLVPSDSQTAEIMAGYREGETRGGKLTMPRSVQFHRLAHAIGGLVADNVDSFHGMDAHTVIKRLQVESGVGCDEMAILIGGQQVIHRIPQSLSFSAMSQDTFKRVMTGICEHIVSHYWPDTSVDEIQQMADEHMRGSV